MSAVGTATSAATILSGIVSLIIILSVVADAITHGWVRRRVRGWLGITRLRGDHLDTQTFLMDLGDAYNDLSSTVCENHDVPAGERPRKVDVDFYERRLDDETDLERGDFYRGGGD